MRRSSRPNDSFGELAAQEPTTDFLAPTGQQLTAVGINTTFEYPWQIVEAAGR
jgi:hypothetical protein